MKGLATTLLALSMATCHSPQAKVMDSGDAHTCAVDRDGRLWCWGNDDVGQLGDGPGISTSATRVPVDMSNDTDRKFVSVSAGSLHSCALDSEGEAWCWGFDHLGQIGDPDFQNTPGGFFVPKRVENLPGRKFSAIATGEAHTCAVEQSGQAWCWGSDRVGQLGDGIGTESKPTPQMVAVPPGIFLRSIVAGGAHSCALDDAGHAWCWGWDEQGELGDGDNGPQEISSTPVEVAGAMAFTELAAGDEHTCGITKAGAVSCWGWNGWGQLGEAPAPYQLHEPHLIDTDAFDSFPLIDLAAGGNTSCAISSEHAVWCWGADNQGQRGDGKVAFGYRGPTKMKLPDGLDKPYQVSTNGSVTCIVDESGVAACTGSRLEGELGDGEFGYSTIPSNTFQTVFSSISAGYDHACALDSAGRPWCWGNNSWGEVGQDEYDYPFVHTPMPVDEGVLNSNIHLQSVVAEYGDTCGLDTLGKIWCWGSDSGAKAVQIAASSGKPYTQVVAGHLHTCALDTGGDAWCWGRDDYGQLGDDPLLAEKPEPVKVAVATKLKRLAAGEDHTCAIGQTLGEVYCWGGGYSGQLARGADLDDKPTPVLAFGSNAAFSDIEAGRAHTCGVQAISGDSTRSRLLCWGENSSGQIGDGTHSDATLPVEVATIPGSGASAIGKISLGGSHTCAQRPGGYLVDLPYQCWGSNRYGQLADGTRASSSTPQLTWSFGFGAVLPTVSAGDDFTCALSPEHRLMCTGRRDYGQLGDGQNSFSLVPIVLVGFNARAARIFRDGLETP